MVSAPVVLRNTAAEGLIQYRLHQPAGAAVPASVASVPSGSVLVAVAGSSRRSDNSCSRTSVVPRQRFGEASGDDTHCTRKLPSSAASANHSAGTSCSPQQITFLPAAAISLFPPREAGGLSLCGETRSSATEEPTFAMFGHPRWGPWGNDFGVIQRLDGVTWLPQPSEAKVDARCARWNAIAGHSGACPWLL